MKNNAIWITLAGLGLFVYGMFKLVSNVKPAHQSKEHMQRMTEKSIEARNAKKDENGKEENQ